MLVIPAIDLKGGRYVRLLQGDFAKETRYGDDPLPLARQYREQGFEYLHVVDLDGARTGEQRNRDLVARLIQETELAVQLGGGIRSRETIRDWIDAGISRCVIGSIAVDDPHLVTAWLREFGAERIVLALDVRIDEDGTPQLATHGWTRTAGVSLWQRLEEFGGSGLQHVLCTDIGQDGALGGPNTELYREFIARFPQLKLQASGGVRDCGDLGELRALGCAAAVTGRALLDGRITTGEVSSFLRSA